MTLTPSNEPELTPQNQTSTLGSLSAELLVICLNPDEAAEKLAPFLEIHGITFSQTTTDPSLIQGRITKATVGLPSDHIPLPEELDTCCELLAQELQSLSRLRLVLVMGVSAHIIALKACGIPLTRLDVRPGDITRLPDGLLLADGCHLPDAETDLLHHREDILGTLMPRIRLALRPPVQSAA